MTDAIAVIGQSNAQLMWDVANASEAPLPNTFMWHPSSTPGAGWMAPRNSLATFANAVARQSNKPVYVLPAAIGGTGLLPNTQVPYWLNLYGVPLTMFFNMITAAQVTLVGLYWWQGEYEATVGPFPNARAYGSAIVELHAKIAGFVGKHPGALPMLVQPIHCPGLVHTSEIVAEQEWAVINPGIFVAPSISDLHTYDGIHLDNPSREIAAKQAGKNMIMVFS